MGFRLSALIYLISRVTENRYGSIPVFLFRELRIARIYANDGIQLQREAIFRHSLYETISFFVIDPPEEDSDDSTAPILEYNNLVYLIVVS